MATSGFQLLFRFQNGKLVCISCSYLTGIAPVSKRSLNSKRDFVWSGLNFSEFFIFFNFRKSAPGLIREWKTAIFVLTCHSGTSLGSINGLSSSISSKSSRNSFDIDVGSCTKSRARLCFFLLFPMASVYILFSTSANK